MLDNYTVIGFSRFTSNKSGSPRQMLVAHVVCDMNQRDLMNGSIGQKCSDLFLDVNMYGHLAVEANVGKVAIISKDLDNMVSKFEFVD